jgi:hypothetical protein
MAMPSSTFDGQNAWSYEEVAALPLPGPALVIDVRQFENQLEFDPMALLVSLWTEMNDIAGEMRQHGMESWGSLQSFLGFRKLNAGDGHDYHVYDPRSWEPGRGPEEYCPADQLAPLFGKLVNDLRNRRISQARSGDPEQATVRVIFLVDLADQEQQGEQQEQMAGRTGEKDSVSSFDLAVRCAGLLKAWLIEEQGLRSDYDEAQEEPRWRRANYGGMLETVALCLNTRVRKHYHLLTEANAVRALDLLILVQPYRLDYGHLGPQAQVSHAELILSALLLHWPEAMQSRIEDEPFSHIVPLVHGPLPRPVYILGAAAIEHSARWGERLWDYGLETALLEKLLANEQVEKQDVLLQDNFEQWWENWRAKVQWIPLKLKEHLTQLGGLRNLENLYGSALFQAHSLSDLKYQLETFFQWVKQLYAGQGAGSLRQVLESAPLLVDLGKQIHMPPNIAEQAWNACLEDLRVPEREAQVFLLALFAQARGSVPHALRHLQLLEERIESLRLDTHKCDLQTCLNEWENWYEQALQRLEALEHGRRPRERKLVQKERDFLLRGAQALQQKHRTTIYRVLDASYALVLLERADFTRPYSKRLKELQRFLENIRKRSRYLRDVAVWRLALGSQKPLVPVYGQQERPATLLNRQDNLDQQVLWSHFERALDGLKKEEESFAVQFLAQSSLRFLGPEEHVNNGANGHRFGLGRLLNEQLALEHFHVLEILLVSGFLASRAGAKLTKIEPLLSNYHQAIQRLQPEPGLLTQTIREMEETIRFVSLQKKIYGDELPLTIPWKVPDELPLAALMAGQPRDPELWSVLSRTNLLRFLDKSTARAKDVVEGLDSQAKLAGFPDMVSGDETCYLYLPPGWESESFERALDQQLRPAIHIIRTPNLEKMIYLRIHRVHQFPGDDIPD